MKTYALFMVILLVACQNNTPSSPTNPQEFPSPSSTPAVAVEPPPAAPATPAAPEGKTEMKMPENPSPETVKTPSASTPAPAPSPPPVPASGTADLGKDYEVISVQGKVRNIRNQESLQPGSRIRPDDVLLFGSQSDDLVLINAEKRLFSASPGSDLRSYQLESLRGATQGRPGKILTYLEFQQFLKGKKWLVLGGKVELEIGGSEFPMDDHRFFYIEYNYQGESIPKQLPQRGNILIIDKTELYKVDGNPISASRTSDARLFYYDDAKESSLLINPIQLVFPNETQLKAEVGVIVNRFGGRSARRDDLLAAVTQYLTDRYGSPEKENLSGWLRKNFGV